ncbi:putative cytochrome P450 [Aaosphaeria arxii CBS 175.79]|uniref:Putative cytochrome P450 n=1 Tax=Aaosphaeria arxii CBS 175.79 TaxID=1450172 RepID=A0A6A5XEX8_9PLEO|nr:putative cytochrome P450 [Aaosphaeria arxii CBS 175.79]KAF2011419.1 putative cytochrome P450 [Aaosphaeria arxii CBS 175.79]
MVSADSMFGILSTSVCVGILFVVFKIIQRLFFHPLSGVPGPWYAAVSTFYEFWWNCIQDGRYMFEITRMHDVYGPVVRINPWEVHIRDPAYYDTLLSNPRVEKDPFYYGGFGTPNSSVTTVPVPLHKIRRGAVAPFFSRANVSKLEPRTLAHVKQLCERVRQHQIDGKVVDISNAFRCLATDVVTDYAAPTTRNYLAHEDFAAKENGTLRGTSVLIHWNRHIRFTFPLVRVIPRWFVALFDKTGASVALIDNQAELLSQAKAAVSRRIDKDTPTVLGTIVTNPSLSASEKSLQRVFDETVVLIGAGTETTGITLTVLTYHVLANPSILQSLKAELDKAAAERGVAKGDFLTSKTVESLPYLQAVLKEALRMGTSVSGRLPRRHPTETLSYTDQTNKRTYTFPPNTTISMSLRDTHFDPEIFPDPNTFNPDRWLIGSREELAWREKHMVAFGKGVRQCVGLELAKQEILLGIANLFWQFDMELFETGLRDVSTEHDFFSPFGPADSKGLRVKVKV